VAAACRGCRAAVRDGETGLLVPVGDAPALAEAILRILRDPALARRMGQAGRERALARGRERALALGREGFMRAVHEVYERVLELPAPGARAR
jgi:glycosyltransferase involved in cell wall biosynthesis